MLLCCQTVWQLLTQCSRSCSIWQYWVLYSCHGDEDYRSRKIESVGLYLVIWLYWYVADTPALDPWSCLLHHWLLFILQFYSRPKRAQLWCQTPLSAVSIIRGPEWQCCVWVWLRGRPFHIMWMAPLMSYCKFQFLTMTVCMHILTQNTVLCFHFQSRQQWLVCLLYLESVVSCCFPCFCASQSQWTISSISDQ